jgi:hypothetical protein
MGVRMIVTMPMPMVVVTAIVVFQLRHHYFLHGCGQCVEFQPKMLKHVHAFVACHNARARFI